MPPEKLTTPLTRAILDEKKCEISNCSHDHSILVLAPRCHIMGYLEATYNRQTGVLKLACSTCGAQVTTVQVAP